MERQLPQLAESQPSQEGRVHPAKRWMQFVGPYRLVRVDPPVSCFKVNESW